MPRQQSLYPQFFTMSTPRFTSQIPEKQKAWVVTGKGSVGSVLKFDENFPVPSKLAPGEVLVKVHAAALNPAYVILYFMILGV